MERDLSDHPRKWALVVVYEVADAGRDLKTLQPDFNLTCHFSTPFSRKTFYPLSLVVLVGGLVSLSRFIAGDFQEVNL